MSPVLATTDQNASYSNVMQRFLLPILTLLVLGLILGDRLGRRSRPAIGSVAEAARPVAKSGLPARSPPGLSLTTPAESGTPTIERLARLATRRALNGEGQATYLDSLLSSTDSVLRRWPTPMGRPIRIALVEREPATYASGMGEQVRDAFRRWESLGLDLSFQYVADTVQADVVVRWIARFPVDRTGQTDLTWDQFGRVQRALITLGIADGQGSRLPDQALLSVSMHEVGHALGLPHSADQADVMFPEPRITDLSVRDRRTAVMLYQLPSGSVRDSGQ